MGLLMQRESGAKGRDGAESPGYGTSRPLLVCLAATPQDRQDLQAIIAVSGLPVGVVPDSNGRTAILAGPDAAGEILRGTIPATGPNGSDHGRTVPNPLTITPTMLDMDTASPAMFDGMPPIAAPSADHVASPTADHDRTVLARLTPREAEVARYVGEGLNVEEIAVRLRREKTTIISHRRSLLRKIGCRNALGIARFAYRVGLTTP